ncbi:hypothetical protein [Streptomyces violaceusniger]|uniref:hypothetical protein n=1 Tax=Streptomyces violaceusniger TaxID=68280 RepID=UPI0009977C64|nr:hypothetical protein [Streptomyces hygroscopicus]AQW54696.1 hypothetical protein SHXM_08159 [Streptomyces hygroscopicus]
MVGSVIVFAAARDTRWGRAGVILSIPVLIIFSPITTKAFGALLLPVEPELGTLRNVGVLDQPGPPLAISWTVCAIPPVGMLAYLAVGWRRNRPSEKVATLI